MSSLLPAHEQSIHLFNKYLERQQHENDSQRYQPAQLHPPRQQQQQRVLRPWQNQHSAPFSDVKSCASFLQHQIPPPKVSAFLPKNLDWSQCYYPQQHEGSGNDSDSGEDLENSEEDICVFLKSPSQKSVPIASQTIGWRGAMEPAKAAVVDMWRPSLLKKIRSCSPHPDSSESQIVKWATKFKILPGKRCPSHELGFELTRNKAPEPGKEDDAFSSMSSASSSSRSKWPSLTKQLDRPRQLTGGFPRKSTAFYDQSRQQLRISSYTDDNVPLGMVKYRHTGHGRGEVPVTGPGIQHQPVLQKQSHENQAAAKDGILDPEHSDVGRFSRWQKTQLPSEDDSGTNQESLPSEDGSGTNRESFSALTMQGASRCLYLAPPNRDLYLSSNHRDCESRTTLFNNRISNDRNDSHSNNYSSK
ncbi:hypothetical protein BGZ54_000852, partial [Gamsiella multidivaricata]